MFEKKFINFKFKYNFFLMESFYFLQNTKLYTKIYEISILAEQKLEDDDVLRLKKEIKYIIVYIKNNSIEFTNEEILKILKYLYKIDKVK